MIAPRTDWVQLARASTITVFASARSTRRIRLLTGPIDAGRIESLRSPMAAKHIASIGRPASSPQNDTGVPASSHRSAMRSMKLR